MARIRACWWTPQGTTSDKDKDAPASLLQAVSSSIPEDAIFDQHFLTTAIEASVCVLGPDDRPLNEYDTASLVDSSIREIRSDSTPLSPQRLLETISRKAIEFFREPSVERYVVTSLSIKDCDKFPIDVAGTQLEVANRTEFPWPSNLVGNTGYTYKHVTDSRYCPISVQTHAITEAQAFDVGLSAVTYLRGIWNLIATFDRPSIHWNSSPQRILIGKVFCSPVHTLHAPDGKAIDNLYCYDTTYAEDAQLFAPTQGWDSFCNSSRVMMERATITPYFSNLRRLLERYAEAISHFNLDVVFLMLWSLLEKITDTVGANYDKTIKRALWPFADRDLHGGLLQYIRRSRNGLVHSSKSSSTPDQLCYMTKRFVDWHLKFLIDNPYDVRCLQQYGEFLDMPHDTKCLEFLHNQYARAFTIQQRINSGRGDGSSKWEDFSI